MVRQDWMSAIPFFASLPLVYGWLVRMTSPLDASRLQMSLPTEVQ